MQWHVLHIFGSRMPVLVSYCQIYVNMPLHEYLCPVSSSIQLPLTTYVMIACPAFTGARRKSTGFSRLEAEVDYTEAVICCSLSSAAGAV